jgi:hypothetical protein
MFGRSNDKSFKGLSFFVETHWTLTSIPRAQHRWLRNGSFVDISKGRGLIMPTNCYVNNYT